MRPPGCVACGLPVLELVGQSATLPPYLASNGSPAPETAGSWHLSCLRLTPVAEQWYQALERSYLSVRQYTLLARTPNWTVVQNPRSREVLGLGRSGATLPLSDRGPMRRTAGNGHAYDVAETDYWLDWDLEVVAELQDRLRRHGCVSVPDVAARLGIADRLSHPDLLAGAAFRLDESLISDWTSTAVGASVDYAVQLPDELVSSYRGPS